MIKLLPDCVITSMFWGALFTLIAIPRFVPKEKFFPDTIVLSKEAIHSAFLSHICLRAGRIYRFPNAPYSDFAYICSINREGNFIVTELNDVEP